MNEQSEVSGCYNITFNYTNQVCVGKDKQTKHLEHEYS